jgi:hypothetical protein
LLPVHRFVRQPGIQWTLRWSFMDIGTCHRLLNCARSLEPYASCGSRRCCLKMYGAYELARRLRSLCA